MTVDGIKETRYRLEKKEAMRVVGIMRHFKAPENDPSDVGDFWNELFESGLFEKIAELSNGSPKGVHGFMQVIDNTHVDYMIAAITDKEVPRDDPRMEEHIIPTSTWAIFEQAGSVQNSMASVWQQIFEEWLPSMEYEHAGTVEIECFCYSGDRTNSDI